MNTNPNTDPSKKTTADRKIKCILFDLDGTLLNTLDDLQDAVNAALSAYALPLRTKEEVCSFVGNGIAKLVERAIPGGIKHPQFDDIYAYFCDYYEKHCQDKTSVYEGILPLLDQLKKEGIKLAVVSNKANFAVQELIPTYFGKRMDAAHGEEESAGIKKKPAPDMVFLTLNELSCLPEESLYVGDSEVDRQTAINAGVPCVSVSWGYRSRRFLKAHGAEYIIDHPSELINILHA